MVDRSAEGAIYKGLAIASSAGRRRLPLRDRLPQRPRRRLRRQLPPGDQAGRVRRSAICPPASRRSASRRSTATSSSPTRKQDADAEDDVAGPGLGFVDMYSRRGNLLGPGGRRRTAELALGARDGAGRLRPVRRRPPGRELRRRRKDQRLRAGLERVRRTRRLPAALQGQPVAIDGLWALSFGNGGPAGAKGGSSSRPDPTTRATGCSGGSRPTSRATGLRIRREAAGQDAYVQSGCLPFRRSRRRRTARSSRPGRRSCGREAPVAAGRRGRYGRGTPPRTPAPGSGSAGSPPSAAHISVRPSIPCSHQHRLRPSRPRCPRLHLSRIRDLSGSELARRTLAARLHV